MPTIKVISTSEVSAGTMKKVVLDNMTLLIANVDGKFYALNNTCPHLGGSLSDGKLEGKIVQCPRHGSRFDVTTGANVGGAKIAFLKMKVKDTQSYPVTVQGQEVMVELPD